MMGICLYGKTEGVFGSYPDGCFKKPAPQAFLLFQVRIAGPDSMASERPDLQLFVGLLYDFFTTKKVG